MEYKLPKVEVEEIRVTEVMVVLEVAEELQLHLSLTLVKVFKDKNLVTLALTDLDLMVVVVIHSLLVAEVVQVLVE